MRMKNETTLTSAGIAAHRVYIGILQRMTPEQRLRKAFELTEFSKRLFKTGLRKRFPGMSDEEFRKLYLSRLDKCHNRNY